MRGVYKILILIVILSIISSCSPTITGNIVLDDQNKGEGALSEEKQERIYTVDPTDFGEAYDSKENSLDATKLEGQNTITDYTGSIETETGSIQGTFTDAIFSKDGFYQATITGIAAGTTIYFLSLYDNSIFEYTASTDESEVRVVQIDHQEDGTPIITIEMSEDDTLKSGQQGNTLSYEFIADKDGYYEYEAGGVTRTQNGVSSYNGEYTETFTSNENIVEAAYTYDSLGNGQGFYNTTLYKDNVYTYNLDFINATITNANKNSVVVCKAEQECEVLNKGNEFIIKGEGITLEQDGYIIIDSKDKNNVITLNYAEETLYVENLNPSEEILGTFRTGYHKIEELNEDISFEPTMQEYPIIFTLYDSNKAYPPLELDSNGALNYQDEDSSVKMLPSDELIIKTCIEKVKQKIKGEIDELPSYC